MTALSEHVDDVCARETRVGSDGLANLVHGRDASHSPASPIFLAPLSKQVFKGATSGAAAVPFGGGDSDAHLIAAQPERGGARLRGLGLG